MTGGGDLDAIEDEDSDVMEDDGDLDVPDVDADESGGTGDGDTGAAAGADVSLNENDPDPTAGASDVGGVPGGVEPETDDTRGEDEHEVGGGHSGMGPGPTGS
jgi:hypothetical protein